MYGLMVYGATGLYLLLSILIVLWAVRYSRRHGKNVKRWGIGAALGMYLIPFWDWLPTVAMHQYYCATEAGFWVYKSVDQWKAENPGALQKLVSYNRNADGFNVDWPSRYEYGDEGHTLRNISQVNERFTLIVTQSDVSNLIRIIRRESALLDNVDGSVMARYVDYGTGNSVKNTIGPPGPMKYWLISGRCSGGKESRTQFGKYYIQFQGGNK